MPDEAPPILDVPPTTTPEQAGILRDLQATRQRVATAETDAKAARAERDAAIAERDQHRADAESWRGHTAAQVKAQDTRNSERLGKVPEKHRERLGKLDRDALSAALDAIEDSVPAAPPAPPVPAPDPAYPAGGRAGPSGVPGSLPPDVERWVAEERRDLASVSPDIVIKAYNKFGPGATAP